VIRFVEYASIDLENIGEFIASSFDLALSFKPTEYQCTDADVDKQQQGETDVWSEYF
jgi:hypothetical protein